MHAKQTFILEVGTNASAARIRIVGSSLRHLNDDVLMARSNSRRSRSAVMKVSAPASDISKCLTTSSNLTLPFSSLRKSKLVRRSNIRRNWAPVTTLNICRCKYSRWDRVFLHKYQIWSWNDDDACLQLIRALPMTKHRHNTRESVTKRWCECSPHLCSVSCHRHP